MAATSTAIASAMPPEAPDASAIADGDDRPVASSRNGPAAVLPPSGTSASAEDASRSIAVAAAPGRAVDDEPDPFGACSAGSAGSAASTRSAGSTLVDASPDA